MYRKDRPLYRLSEGTVRDWRVRSAGLLQSSARQPDKSNSLKVFPVWSVARSGVFRDLKFLILFYAICSVEQISSSSIISTSSSWPSIRKVFWLPKDFISMEFAGAISVPLTLESRRCSSVGEFFWPWSSRDFLNCFLCFILRFWNHVFTWITHQPEKKT